MTSYTIHISQPSRSKCPNAWVRLADAPDGVWVHDGDTVPHGATLVFGGSVKRSSRVEKVREEVVADEAGSWAAWGGAGRWSLVAR